MTESEPVYSKASDRSKYPWYVEDISKHLKPKTRALLENYSGIPTDRQSPHVHAIRDQAWAIRTYPCTGMGVWLVPYIAYSPAYSSVLARLQSGGTILDVGCFLGGDLRMLAFDGAPSNRMYGLDIVSHWEVGYELFRDRDRFEARFIESDVLSDSCLELNALLGTVDVISISAVMHQFSWDKQVMLGKKLVQLSGPDAVIVGHQIGGLEAGETNFFGNFPYRHNAESWKKLWDQIGRETHTTWTTEARLLTYGDVGWDPKDHGWMDAQNRVLDFVMTRTS